MPPPGTPRHRSSRPSHPQGNEDKAGPLGTVRLFVAVETPRLTIPELSPLAEDAPSHITLRFLGDVPELLVPQLGPALERSLRGAPSGSIVLRGLGAFPNTERPRVLWAGVVDDGGRLEDLHRRVKEAVEGLGLPPEDHPFHAHVTLARIKGWARAELARRAIEAHQGEVFARFTVQAVVLKQSTLKREGAVHRTILSVPLSPIPS